MLAHTIRDTGALQRVEERIARFSDDADRALTGAPLGDKAVNSLRDLARDATQRTA